MAKVKGFITIPSLYINVPGQNSQFGELSNRSLSFSREQGIYTASQDTLLRSFCVEDDVGNKIVVPPAVATGIGEISQAIFDLFDDDQMGSIADVDALRTQVLTMITSGLVGDLVFEDKINSTQPGQSNYWMPGSALFDMTSGGEHYDIRVWFTNNEFESQYDEYEVVVIPPVMTTVDQLNTTPSNINNLINTATNMANMLPKINIEIGNFPPTVSSSIPLTWHDPSGTSASTYVTPWVFIAWGPNGAQASNIRPVIREYIDNNSLVGQATWETIYPELFESMEFFIIPYWDRIAIPEMGPVSGIYTPILTSYSSINDRGALFAVGLTPPQVAANSALMPALFKSILTVTVGNPSNTNGVVIINQLYSDYCLIPTDHADFDRMSAETKAFVIAMNQGLAIAETATSVSPVPSGFIRETRQGKRYITFAVGGVDFLIPTKETVLAGI